MNIANGTWIHIEQAHLNLDPYEVKKVRIPVKVLRRNNDSSYVGVMPNGELRAIHEQQIEEVMPQGWQPEAKQQGEQA